MLREVEKYAHKTNCEECDNRFICLINPIQYEIITRSQRPHRGRKGGFYGPDMYIVVVERLSSSEPVSNHRLSAANIKKYNWIVHHIGEYYRRSLGPKSRYSRNMFRAKEWIRILKMERKENCPFFRREAK